MTHSFDYKALWETVLENKENNPNNQPYKEVFKQPDGTYSYEYTDNEVKMGEELHTHISFGGFHYLGTTTPNTYTYNSGGICNSLTPSFAEGDLVKCVKQYYHDVPRGAKGIIRKIQNVPGGPNPVGYVEWLDIEIHHSFLEEDSLMKVTLTEAWLTVEDRA